MADAVPSPNSQGTLPQYTWDFLGQLNGGGMKGSEARLVFKHHECILRVDKNSKSRRTGCCGRMLCP
jgi:hypothetical protein